MKINEPKILAALPELGVEVRSGSALADMTSLAIGGTTDLLRLKRHETIPAVLHLLEEHGIPHRFLGGGTNLLVQDGELPWVALQLVGQDPEVRLDGNFASVDAAADLGRTVTFCAKNNLGGMEGLIGVPGTVGGALRMNAGAYGMQIGTYVREITLYRAADRHIETLRGVQISFEYRHTSFAPDDIMLAVKLELPSKPFKEILQGIRICNEKRRASQPLNQKSAGCIFKNPPGASAGRMIDELGLKGHSVGDARVSDRHANFFINAGRAGAYVGGKFLLYSPRVLLTRPEQIEVLGNHVIGRQAIVDKFYADRGRSVLRAPLGQRRGAIESLAWIEQARVQRILPNRIRVEVTERTPVPFLCSGTELFLIDAHGVILDRPTDQEFQFPIVTGIGESVPRDERERRMQTYQQFLKDIDLVKSGSSERVSEVDVSNARDLRVVMTGLAGGAGVQPVTVDCGQGDFVGKYRMLVDNFSLCQANAGSIQSIDLQYTRQVVVNPEANVAGSPAANHSTRRSVARQAGAGLPKQKSH